jgi:high-affinity nickel permease
LVIILGGYILIAIGLATSSFLLLAGLIAGMRHGIDWDHIAAISDITSTQNKISNGILMSFLYGLGHACVVAGIALGLLLMSFALPNDFDKIMEKVVGFTLVILGIYVLYSMYKKKGKDFKLIPRWALMVNIILNTYSWFKAKITNTHRKHHQVLKNGYGNRASYLIGMVHGIGAETPSQMMLFAMAITTGVSASKKFGIMIIIAYSLGLVMTNTIMGGLGAYGYIKSGDHQRLYRYVAFFTGSFSIVIGVLFLTGYISNLPNIENMFSG